MTSIDEQVEFLQNNIVTLYNTHVPIKNSNIKKPCRPWFSKEIKDSIKSRNEAYKKWKKYKTDQLNNIFKMKRRQTVAIIKKLRKSIIKPNLVSV